MKRKYMIGYALAAAFCAGQANAEELTGTLKNVKAVSYTHLTLPTKRIV